MGSAANLKSYYEDLYATEAAAGSVVTLTPFSTETNPTGCADTPVDNDVIASVTNVNS